jgi:hypothetical protein
MVDDGGQSMVGQNRRCEVAAAALATIVLAIGCGGVQPRGGAPSRPQVVILDLEDVEPVLVLVEEITARRFDVIPAERYWTMARRLKAEKITAKNVSRLASSLEAIAVVHATVKKRKRGRGAVTVFVRDGETGKVSETYRLQLRRGKIARADQRKLDRKFLATVEPPPEEMPEEEPEAPAKPEKTARKDRPDKDAKPAKAEKTAKADKPAKPDKAKAGKAGRAEEDRQPALTPVETDESGQAIDDEMPPM